MKTRVAPPPRPTGGMRNTFRRAATVMALTGTLVSAMPSTARAASREAPVPNTPTVSRTVTAAAPAAGDRKLPPVADMVAGAVSRVQPARTGGAGGTPDMILASAAPEYCETGSAGRRHQAARGAHELKMREYVQQNNERIRSARSSALKGAVMMGAAAVLAGVAGKSIGHRFGASRGGSGRNFTPIAIAGAVAPGVWKMARAGDFGRSGIRPGKIIERTNQPLVAAPDCKPGSAGAGGSRAADRNGQAPAPQARTANAEAGRDSARTPLQMVLDRHRQQQAARTNARAEAPGAAASSIPQDRPSMASAERGRSAAPPMPPTPPGPARGLAAAHEQGRAAESQQR
jgi:hypothetical protein